MLSLQGRSESRVERGRRLFGGPLWYALARPVAPPPGWIRTAAAIASVTSAGIVATIAWGHVRYGNPRMAFGEWRPGTILAVTILGAAGVVAARVAAHSSAPALRRRWWLTAALLLYLAFDDLLLIHEGIDQHLHALVGRDPSGSFSDHLDDVIVATYWGIFVAIWWRDWRAFVRHTWMLRTLAVAFVAYAAMVVCDASEYSKVIEDSLKIAGGALILSAFAAAYFEVRPALARNESRPQSRSP